MSTPYTYLIGWRTQNKWYYGVRYASNCHPTDLWIAYFTSSKHVKTMVELYGDPDIINIRKTFATPIKAKVWEEKVLRRVRAVITDKWLNLSQPNSFRNVSVPWNKGLTKSTSPTLLKLSTTLKQVRADKKWGTRGVKRTLIQKEINSWTQILVHSPNFPYNTYQEFKVAVCKLYESGIVGVYSISTLLKVNGQSVKTVLINAGLPISNDQVLSKLIKHYGMRWNTYDAFVDEVYGNYILGKTPFTVSKIMKVNEHSVNSALAIKGVVVLKTDPYWTRLLNTHPNFPFATSQELAHYCWQESIKGRSMNSLSNELKISDGKIKRIINHHQSANTN